MPNVCYTEHPSKVRSLIKNIWHSPFLKFHLFITGNVLTESWEENPIEFQGCEQLVSPSFGDDVTALVPWTEPEGKVQEKRLHFISENAKTQLQNSPVPF